MDIGQLGIGPSGSSIQVAQEPYAAARPWLVARMRTFVRDANVAEDVSQEALLRLALEIRAGRAPDSIHAWLMRVAVNLAVDQSRRAQVARRHANELVGSVGRSSPEDLAIEHERTLSMCRVLDELGPDDRRILLMAASGRSGIEIARRFGHSHAAVRTRLHRLRARVRGRLAALEAA